MIPIRYFWRRPKKYIVLPTAASLIFCLGFVSIRYSLNNANDQLSIDQPESIDHRSAAIGHPNYSINRKQQNTDDGEQDIDNEPIDQSGQDTDQTDKNDQITDPDDIDYDVIDTADRKPKQGKWIAADHEAITSIDNFEGDSDRVEIFLKSIYKSNLRLVLLDPATMKSDFSLNDTVSDTTMPNHITTFGLFENDQEQFLNWYRKRVSEKYRLITARGIDYRKASAKESESIFKEIDTHYFIRISSLSIFHIAVIFPRQNYFWIADAKDSNLPADYRFLTTLHYHIPLPMAVEAFRCADHELSIGDELSIKTCIPRDLKFYLWQLPYSQFFECHYHDIVYPFWSRYNLTRAKNTNDQRVALQEIMRISKKWRIPTMISCGTILGWYRQCDYIVHSKDIDVTMMIDEYRYEFFKDLFESRILSLTLRIGTAELGLEFRTHTRRHVWLDVFFAYNHNANETCTFMWNRRSWFETVYPRRTGVCSVELFGVLTFIPCNYHEFVTADYGPHGWFPVNDGSHYANINMNYLKEFDETDEPFMYYQYINGSCQRPDELWGCDHIPPEVTKSIAYQEWLEKHGQKKKS